MLRVDPPEATIYQFPVDTSKLSATEETGAVPIAPGEAREGEAKDSGRPFLTRRNLTEEEAASPAGLRWLQHDAERLDRDCAVVRKENQDLRERYDALQVQLSDKRVEIERLTGSSRISLRNEILSYLCLTAGAAGLGAAPAYLSAPSTAPLAMVGLAISGILFLGGLILRAWK